MRESGQWNLRCKISLQTKMTNSERRSIVESAAAFSKKLDIIGIAGGLVIGGQTGAAIALTCGLTYILADIVESRSRKNGK